MANRLLLALLLVAILLLALGGFTVRGLRRGIRVVSRPVAPVPRRPAHA
jgi:hypothetical protein